MKSLTYLLIVLFFLGCKKEKDYQIMSKKSGPLNYRTIDTMCYYTFIENDKKYMSIDPLMEIVLIFFDLNKKTTMTEL